MLEKKIAYSRNKTSLKEDDEEAMVVAVIPRPEPMLRGEEGRGSRFRVTVRARRPLSRGSGYPSPTSCLVPNRLQPEARAPLPPRV